MINPDKQVPARLYLVAVFELPRAAEDQPPDPRAQPAAVCPWCRGMGRLKEYRMGQAIDVKCECRA
jgi:hypothetical protein